MATAQMIITTSHGRAVPIPEPQTRGYFLPLFSTRTREDLEREVERAARAGFNLLVYPIFTNGWTLFPSSAQRANGMPAISPAFKNWNPLEHVTRLAGAANLSVWGLARPYNFHPRHAVTPHKLLHKNSSWRMLRHPSFSDSSTRTREFWHPCPLQQSQPGRRTYRHALSEILIEAVEGYPLDGLLLDCTGFGLCGGTLAEHPFCFCENCRLRYFERFGTTMAEDARGLKLLQVRAWQQQQAQEHLNYLRHRLLRTRRTLRIVCQASPAWRQCPDYVPVRDGGALIDWPELLADGEIEELLAGKKIG